jgi:hypothetical protein
MLTTLLQFNAFNKEFTKARPRLLPLWSLVEGTGFYLNHPGADYFTRRFCPNLPHELLIQRDI